MAYNSSYPQTANTPMTGQPPFIYEQNLAGTSNRIRTQYPMAQLGELRDSGTYERIYVQYASSNSSNLAAGAVALTYSAPTWTTDSTGTFKQTAAATATVGSGSGWTSAAAFAPGDYGWIYKARTSIP